MHTQNNKNHIRFYTPHHFVFYPVMLGLIVSSVYYVFLQPGNVVTFSFITVIFFMIGWLSFMTRQHYALGNQDRIVRLEMRLRYFQLTGQPFDSKEAKLTLAQIAALRFASDAELIALVDRSIREKLSAKDIKESIQVWLPDYMRL